MLNPQQCELSIDQTRMLLLDTLPQDLVELYMISQAADAPLSAFIDECPAISVNIRPRARQLVELSRMNTRWAIKAVNQLSFRAIDTLDALIHFDRVLDTFFLENALRVQNRVALAQALKTKPLLVTILEQPQSIQSLYLAALKETLLAKASIAGTATTMTTLAMPTDQMNETLAKLAKIVQTARQQWRERQGDRQSVSLVDTHAREALQLL